MVKLLIHLSRQSIFLQVKIASCGCYTALGNRSVIVTQEKNKADLEAGMDAALETAAHHSRIIAKIYLGKSDEDLEEQRAILNGILADIETLKQFSALQN